MRVLIGALVLGLAVASQAGAQRSGFTIAPSAAFALLGCDVVGPREPEVEFLQTSGIVARRVVGRDDFEGESCAETLSVLLSSGFRLVTSRPVQRSASREIIVYDLIAR